MTYTEHDGKTIERIEVGDMTVSVYFTDGTAMEIEAHTTEEGHISIDELHV